MNGPNGAWEPRGSWEDDAILTEKILPGEKMERAALKGVGVVCEDPPPIPSQLFTLKFLSNKNVKFFSIVLKDVGDYF